ncbi:integrase [Devosia sp. 17-2-E-8]|nr:integrase [Devosia sp. 17-2-E-8]
MVVVELKGLHKVKSKGKIYYYAWRGGPAIKGQPGTPEFIASYNAAVADFRAPDSDRFRSVIVTYKASKDYKKLATTTKRNWNLWLDRIGAYFGDLRIAQFDRADKIRPIIRKWRNTYNDRPRAADYGMQVLSRVLSFAVELGKVSSNPCEGIKHLYTGSRAEIIWTDADIETLHGGEKSSPVIMQAVNLAAHTGLRASDLIRLSWSHVSENAIIMTTGKSRHRREVVIPLYDELRTLLAGIPKLSPVILTSSRETPWTVSGLNSSFYTAMQKSDLKSRDLHFHDLRGTAATKFYVAGLSERVIAEILGWEEETVAKIIRRYVGRNAAVKAVIEQMAKAKQ